MSKQQRQIRFIFLLRGNTGNRQCGPVSLCFNSQRQSYAEANGGARLEVGRKNAATKVTFARTRGELSTHATGTCVTATGVSETELTSHAHAVQCWCALLSWWSCNKPKQQAAAT
jgi:hypothetical protein